MRRSPRSLVAGLLLMAGAGAAHAVQPDEVLRDPALEGRARALSAELRCLVCQNQSIDDSDAPLARDLRLILRERLKAGDSDAAATSFIVQRYGEFVLLRPVFALHTALLWLTPLLVLATGAFALWRGRARGEVGAPARLTAAEEASLAALVPGSAPPDRDRA